MMRASRTVAPILGLLAALSACPAVAAAGCPEPTGDRAADEHAARELFDEALRIEPAQPEAALEALECAEALAPKPAVALRIGTIAERLGERGLAADAFERYLVRAGDAAPDAAEIRERIAELRRARAAVDAPPGGAVASTVPARDEPAGSTQRLSGWIVTGTGLALGIVGIGLLAAAHVTSNDVHDIEPGTTRWDSDEAEGRYETAETEQSVGIVTLVAGATLAALGIVVVVTAPGDSPVGVTAMIAPTAGGVGLGGRF